MTCSWTIVRSHDHGETASVSMRNSILRHRTAWHHRKNTPHDCTDPLERDAVQLRTKFSAWRFSSGEINSKDTEEKKTKPKRKRRKAVDLASTVLYGTPLIFFLFLRVSPSNNAICVADGWLRLLRFVFSAMKVRIIFRRLQCLFCVVICRESWHPGICVMLGVILQRVQLWLTYRTG